MCRVRAIPQVAPPERDARVWYQDGSGAPAFYDPDTGLVGRPDRIWILRDGALLIEEWKSGRRGGGAQAGHKAQAAAYCLVVAAQTGRRVLGARLVYADGVVEMPWTPELDQWVRHQVARLRAVRAGHAVPTPQPGPACGHCAYRGICPAARRRGGHG